MSEEQQNWQANAYQILATRLDELTGERREGFVEAIQAIAYLVGAKDVRTDTLAQVLCVRAGASLEELPAAMQGEDAADDVMMWITDVQKCMRVADLYLEDKGQITNILVVKNTPTDQ